MRSVSVAALVAAPGVAVAQDDGDDVTYSVELGLLFSPFHIDAKALDKVGVVDVGAIGGRAAVSVGKQLDPFWDLRLSGSINKFVLGTAERTACDVDYPADCGPVAATARFGFTNLDIEVGYTPALSDNGEVRFFAGVRGLHYHDEHSIDKLGEESPFSPDSASYFGAFNGVGPRVGAEGVFRQPGDSFGFSGLFGVAALYGLETRTSEVDGDVDVTEQYITVFNLEGSLGLDYYLDDDTKLTFGYRGEVFFNVGQGLSTSDTRFVHGPTIKLSGKIN